MSANEKLKQIVEAALLSAGSPLNLDAILELFLEEERPDKEMLREVIVTLREDYEGRGIELVEVGGGFRINVRSEFSPWVSRLWEERPARYSRALLETLALIAYRQPVTRGEIEDVRGVSVSSQIIKTLLEREWVRVVGQRDVPGRPSLYATTREFLNYFSLKGLSDLPTLQEIRDFDSINRELELSEVGADSGDNGKQDSILTETGEPPESQSDAGEAVDEVEVSEESDAVEVPADEALTDELTESDDEEQKRDE
ncbi:MAG: SMC-Scp complex subunit ScpB [Sedimenticola sp.]